MSILVNGMSFTTLSINPVYVIEDSQLLSQLMCLHFTVVQPWPSPCIIGVV